MTLLVTGASGFVGGHLLAAALAQGLPVTAWVRPQDDPAALRARVDGYLSQGWYPGPGGGHLGVVAGDFDHPGLLPRLLAAHRDVLHLAGWMRGDDAELYRRVNEGLVRQLVEAPGWTPGHRLVLLSSVAVLGPGTPEAPPDEAATPAPVGVYGATKLAGEHALERARLPCPSLVLRPPSIYGPGDRSFLDAFRMAAAGTYPALGAADLRFQLVDVVDLARALLLACAALRARPLPPLLHLGNPEVVDHPRWRAAFAAAAGREVRPLYLGRVGTAALGLWGALKSVFGGRAELMGWDKARHLLAGDWVHSLAGFGEAVGPFEWTSLEAGTARAHAWYRAAGWT